MGTAIGGTATISEDELSAERVAVSRPRARIPRNVAALGLVSFLADISSEMLYPLVPIFLSTVLGAPVAAIGLIEGVAEGTANLVKGLSGWLSDRVGRRLPLVARGHFLTAVAKLLLALAVGWPFVLMARFVDRLGKGLRAGPRDAILAESVPPADLGRAFGFERSMDAAGAVAGALIDLALVGFAGGMLRLVFAIAFLPELLSVAALGLVRETPRPRPRPIRTERRQFSAGRMRLAWRGVDCDVKILLVAGVAFALANSSDAFLILRAKGLGLSTAGTVLAYVV